PSPFFADIHRVLRWAAPDCTLQKIEESSRVSNIGFLLILARRLNHRPPLQYEGAVGRDIGCTDDDRTLSEPAQNSRADAKRPRTHSTEGADVGMPARLPP